MGNVCHCELDDNLGGMDAQHPVYVKRREKFQSSTPRSARTLMSSTTNASNDLDSLNNSFGGNLVNQLNNSLQFEKDDSS